MPPALFARSVHHSVARKPAAPTGAAMPARIARMPILTGSAGTPFFGCAPPIEGRPMTPPATAAAPAAFRNSRLLAFMAEASFVDERRDLSRTRAGRTCPVTGWTLMLECSVYKLTLPQERYRKRVRKVLGHPRVDCCAGRKHCEVRWKYVLR